MCCPGESRNGIGERLGVDVYSALLRAAAGEGQGQLSDLMIPGLGLPPTARWKGEDISLPHPCHPMGDKWLVPTTPTATASSTVLGDVRTPLSQVLKLARGEGDSPAFMPWDQFSYDTQVRGGASSASPQTLRQPRPGTSSWPLMVTDWCRSKVPSCSTGQDPTIVPVAHIRVFFTTLTF